MSTTNLADRATLEAALLARRRTRERIPRIPRSAGPVTTVEVSAIQQLMWELHHEYPGETTFITLGAIWLRGPLRFEVLQAAYDGLVQRHEACRTLFRTGPDGVLVQDVHRDVRHPIPVREVTPDGIDEAAAAVIDEPFDLVRGPLVRLHLLRVTPVLHQAVLVLHHIVSDGVTMEIFVQELAAAYLAGAQDLPVQLPPVQAQPADVAVWQNARFAAGLRERLSTYWVERLRGFHPPDLPTDAVRAPEPSAAGLTHQLLVDPETVTALGRLAGRERSTLFMVTLAAFQILIGWYAGRRDSGVATPYSYRDRPELANPVGAFINYVVLRVDLAGDPSYRDVLEQVRRTCLADLEHADLPLDDVLAVTGWEPQRGRHALLRTLFTEESDPAVPPAAQGEMGAELVLDPPWHHALRDLSVRFTAGHAGTHIIATYRVDAFTAGRVADLAADFRDLLRAIVADPDMPVYDPDGRPAVPLRVPISTPEEEL